MKRIKKIVAGALCMIALLLSSGTIAYADEIGAGDTGEGDGGGGSNVYTFSYLYDSSSDSIQLRVDTKYPLKSFGNSTTHSYTSPSDNITLYTQYPQLGSSLDGAISSMISQGGYNFTVAEVKSKLNDLGYYDKGNGVWKYNGGYLTYISATRIRPQPKNHTVTYDANGGSGAPGNQLKTENVTLTLSYTRPTRTGYNFINWSASIGGTYNPGSSYTHDQDGGTVTMKANWSPWTHTVTYDANGGSGAPGNQTKTYGSVLTLSSKVPTKTGYSFKGWDASIGGTYQPGGAYSHDQNGGTVTMKAKWVDDIAPSCSSFTAVPNYWSAGNGTVSFTVRDQGSGLASVKLQRYSDVSKSWSDVKTRNYSGTTEAQSGSYTETAEGVFYYRLIITDKAGNTTTKTSNYIYLDHSNPVINGVENTMTDWTNVAPTISVSATDYLYGTSYNGSGLSKIVIKDDAGSIAASGINSTSYTLAKKYEGKHTWTITATDNVGHTSTRTVTTKYDCTAPGIDGTEITFVTPDGKTVSGYCQDNIISQHIDDEISRSPNGANLSSGVKSVILYRVTGNTKEVINTNQTRMRITMHMNGSGGRETCHISLIETGEIYEEVRQKFKHDEEILRTIGVLRQMSVDEVMNTVAENFFIDTRFSYASYVRGNKDWEKECFAKVTESDDSFTTGRYYGEGFITLAMPTATKADLIKRLKELGCEFFFGIDMNALSIEEQSDFNRNLEKKYNRRLSGEGAKDYVNTSMILAIICDSDDARKIVEQTFVSVFEGYGFCMAPAFANQKQVYHSLLSFGIVDAKVMRNVDVNVLSVVFGGESRENAKVEV